jgi:hypothetical protein
MTVNVVTQHFTNWKGVKYKKPWIFIFVYFHFLCWMKLAHDRYKWRISVNTEVNLQLNLFSPPYVPQVPPASSFLINHNPNYNIQNFLVETFLQGVYIWKDTSSVLWFICGMVSVLCGMQIYTRVDVGVCNINIKVLVYWQNTRNSAIFNEGTLF